MVYGVAAGAIRVLKHLAFRVRKKQNENMVGSLRRPSSQRIPKVTEGHAAPQSVYDICECVKYCEYATFQGPFGAFSRSVVILYPYCLKHVLRMLVLALFVLQSSPMS